jgi:hypothetical protein
MCLPVVTAGGNGPAPETNRKLAMTDLKSEKREMSMDELPIDELAIDKLDSVSGGRMKIPGKIVTAADIAKVAAENPGFV